ncbi:hypothetical protein AAFC00_002258 [Neodothiora populina]|uniref:Kinetochore protein Spc24 n=1 Tax=Neodothiora populina TaxID=2781224 RepID=A0ABR3PH77_9PEZI
MVLFDEDPVTLIRQTTNNFHTASDLSSLSRVTSSLSTLQTARHLRLQSATQTLSSLQRTLASKRTQHESSISTHDPAAHASLILSLDTQKFRIAKAASDAEIEAERLEAESRVLKQQLQRLDDEGVEGGSFVDQETRDREDENVLRLKVYRSLGIECEWDLEKEEVRRAVVRRDNGDAAAAAAAEAHAEPATSASTTGTGGHVTVVNIDPKFHRFFYADLFWASL